MSRRAEWILAAVAVALLIAGAILILAERLPVTSIVLDDACRTHATIIEPASHTLSASSAPRWTAVVLHGLAANRRVMFPIGQQLARAGAKVYMLDLPGEGDSTSQFSYANNERCAALAIASLAKSGAIEIDRTVVVGHSLGGAAAIRLSDRFHDFAGIIALSPAPIVFPHHAPENLLIESAQFDPPQLKSGAQQMSAAAGGVRDSPRDFAEKRAVGYAYTPFALHGSVLFDPRVLNLTVRWAQQSVGIANPAPAKTYREMLALFGIGMGLAGIGAILPVCATWIGRVCCAFSRRSHDEIIPGLSSAELFLRVAVASFSAVSLLILGVPLRMLHLFSADYVASVLSLAGVLLLVLLPLSVRANARADVRSQLGAILFAVATMLAFGLWLNWQVTNFLPAGPRAWRVIPLALVTWPFFAAEELAMGPPEAKHKWRRWLVFLGIRATLLAAMALGYFAFGNGEYLPILISPFMLAISILQRRGSDRLRSRGAGAIAGATFDAILAAWFFAAVFPLQ